MLFTHSLRLTGRAATDLTANKKGAGGAFFVGDIGEIYFSPTTITLTEPCTSACSAITTSYSPVVRIGPSPWITSFLWIS